MENFAAELTARILDHELNGTHFLSSKLAAVTTGRNGQQWRISGCTGNPILTMRPRRGAWLVLASQLAGRARGWSGMADGISVAGVQVRTVAGERDANLARAAALVRAHPGHDLYVLPELSAPGYGDEAFAARAALAERADASGPSFRFCGALAAEADACVAYGFLRARDDGGVAIAHAVVAPPPAAGAGEARLVATYDKMHLCDMGACSETAKGVARPETPEPCVFECAGVRVGLCICYDLRFPELWRRMCWAADGRERGGDGGDGHAADLVVHPSAFVRDATFPTWHAFVTTRAVENQVYVLSVSHAGPDFGGSVACPPWVGPVARAAGEPDLELAPTVPLGDGEGVVALRVERAVLAAVREQFPYRRDARVLPS